MSQNTNYVMIFRFFVGCYDNLFFIGGLIFVGSHTPNSIYALNFPGFCYDIAPLPPPLIYSPIRVKTAWIEPTPAKRPNDKKKDNGLLCLLVLSQELKGNCQPDKHSFISKSIIIENDMDNNKRIIYLFLIKKRVSNIFLYNNDSLGYH